MMCRLIKLFIIAFCLWVVCDAQAEGYFNQEKVDLSVWHQRNPRVAIRTNDQLACEKPSIYFCEEPPNLIPPQSTKTCNYRNVWYQEQVFRWVAGRGCLLYTPDFLFVGSKNPINLNAGCVYGNLFAPCLEVVKDDGTCGCFPFDPSLEVVAKAVRQALVPSIHGRWERCFYGASECCSHFMNGNHNVSDTNQCPPTYDGWTCWQPAQNGSVARSVCPEFAYSNSGPACHHFSHKQCHSHGTWELRTDYSTCSITPRLLRRYRYYIAVLIFSVISSFPAICIFIFYKRLRVTRVTLHRNLLIAIVFRNIIVIISRNVIYIDELTNAGETIMSQNGVGCRVLSFIERLSGNAVFVCMLLEGIYLHRLIVAVFKQKLSTKMLYSVGILYAILPVIAWSVVMSLFNNHSCWLVYTVAHVEWALDAPRLLILLINAVLYIDVLRVLFTKIRNNENANQLSTAKATLFLMPIFGVQFLFTVFRPYNNNCDVEQFYYIVAYTIEGLQGFIVALLYCYINKEVHALIKATYKKAENTVTSRIKGSSFYPRISGDPKTGRRFTYTSALTTNTTKADELKNQYSTMEPKVHVAEIISIQASERLAKILDPVYETIDNGLHGSYDYLERSNADHDTEFIPNRNFKIDEYYGFTNASSVSIGWPERLRRVSSSSTGIYNTSLTACHVIQEEIPDTNSLETKTSSGQSGEDNNSLQSSEYENAIDNIPEHNNIDSEKVLDKNESYAGLEIDCGTCENMLDEIMQCMENKDNSDVTLNSDLLAPNRSKEDKIVFVE
ncbi:uncharacterized protein LOC123867633 isoform X1 [Maniola jurtina]|uniref:uncharacterized protein LOC123867633 isoform X1 n=1 Tax=Maniola jurtina TaxID=191418 RepID=UPI001E68ED76|nr:uncharacterized protein LOC123867633 isoform X1 [Maniola jurtina]